MSGKQDVLRVLMVTPRYFPCIGGTERHVHEVGRRLAAKGVDVTLLTTLPHTLSTLLPKEEVVDGMKVIRVQAWPHERDYFIAPEMYSIIRHGKWDLVHCQGYHTFVPLIAMLAAKAAHIPYVVTFHSGGNVSLFRKAFRGLQSMALRPLLAGAERLVGPSKWEVEFFRGQLHLPDKQFVLIPNGAHHLPVAADTATSVKNSTLIVSIGRLERYKGHQRVIAALPEVLKHVPDARLRIVGVGPYELELQKLARRLGVTERVEIRAVPLSDNGGVASVIAQSDLVTLLSEHEAQGLTVLEALALQRPVLVAATTALNEYAELGLARAVPLKSSPKAVARAIVNQLLNPLIPGSINLPTWDECATNLLTLYESVTQKSPALLTVQHPLTVR